MPGRLRITIAVLALLALIPAAALSSAQAGRTGSLEATGTGTIAARGNLTAFGKIDGVILVRDRSGRAMVKLDGVRQRPKVVGTGLRRVRVYTIRNADGAFYIQGREVQLELRSPVAELSLTMFGQGTVTKLRGEGTYRLNAGEARTWAEAQVPMQLKPPRRGR